MHLIVSNATDHHAEVVQSELSRRGAVSVRLDLHELQWTFGAGGTCRSPTVRLNTPLGGCNAQDITSVWLRRPSAAAPDLQFAAESLWTTFRDRFWINPYEAEFTARSKPLQLKIAQVVGLDIPRTVITNSASEATEFVRRCCGRAMYKTFEPTTRAADHGRRRGVYASVVSSEDVEKLSAAIPLAPCLLQEFLEKAEEYRTTVMGGQLFTVAISDPSGRPFRQDYRRQWRDIRCRPCELPAAVAAKISALCTRLDLVFGCVDLIRTADDRFVFLEVNSSGQWYWVQLLSGLPLLESFAEMLIRGTPQEL